MHRFSRFPLMVLLITALLSAPSLADSPHIDHVDVLIGFNDSIKPHILTSFHIIPTHQFKYMPVISATIPHTIIPALSKSPAIAYVEPDSRVYVLQQHIPWGVAHIGAIDVHIDHGFTGSNVNVAILDTGIDPYHRDLWVYGGVSFVGGSWYDGHGHGTHIAGTVAALDNSVDVIGVAPSANLFAVKVLNDDGSGTYSGIAQGIEWCISNGMDVINIGLGGSIGSSALEQACNNAWNAGILIVAAAGNRGSTGPSSDTISYPAGYPSVIAVGATDPNDVRASFSSCGPALELMAPGVNIPSTRAGGGIATYSGTSMASAHVSGTAALLLHANPNLTNSQMRDTLNTTAVWLPHMDPFCYGNGRVDAYAAVTYVLSDRDPQRFCD